MPALGLAGWFDQTFGTEANQVLPAGQDPVSYTHLDVYKRQQYMTTVTTATLELGIDIGRSERAFQIDAPRCV